MGRGWVDYRYCEGDLVTYLFNRSARVTFVGGWVGVGRLQTYCECDLITYLFKRSDRITFAGEESGWME